MAGTRTARRVPIRCGATPARRSLVSMRRVAALMRVRFMLGGMGLHWLGRRFPEPFDIMNVRHVGVDISAAGEHVVRIEALPLCRCVKTRAHAGRNRVDQQLDYFVGRARLQCVIRGWYGGPEVETCRLQPGKRRAFSGSRTRAESRARLPEAPTAAPGSRSCSRAIFPRA